MGERMEPTYGGSRDNEPIEDALPRRIDLSISIEQHNAYEIRTFVDYINRQMLSTEAVATYTRSAHRFTVRDGMSNAPQTMVFRTKENNIYFESDPLSTDINEGSHLFIGDGAFLTQDGIVITNSNQCVGILANNEIEIVDFAANDDVEDYLDLANVTNEMLARAHPDTVTKLNGMIF
jgi:hypothetical protein